MNPTNYSLQGHQTLSVNGMERWDVYHRLQELEIPCQCSINQPLTVQISCPNHLLQVWIVVKRINSLRHDLVATLENSWQI